MPEPFHLFCLATALAFVGTWILAGIGGAIIVAALALFIGAFFAMIAKS